MIDPEIIDEVVHSFLKAKPDYASNTLNHTYPRGLDTEVMTTRPLLATLQAKPALTDGALYSPSEVLILATLRLQDPALRRLARTGAGWLSPAMEQDAYGHPTRVRVLAQAQPDA